MTAHTVVGVVLISVLVWVTAEMIFISLSIAKLHKAIQRLDCAKKLLVDGATPSDVLMAEGYILQAEDIAKEARGSLTGRVIRWGKKRLGRG